MPSMDELLDRLYNALYFMGVRTQKKFDEYAYPIGSFETYQQKFGQDVYSAIKTYQVDYLFYGPREKERFQIEPGETYSFLDLVYDDGSVKIYRFLDK